MIKTQTHVPHQHHITTNGRRESDTPSRKMIHRGRTLHVGFIMAMHRESNVSITLASYLDLGENTERKVICDGGHLPSAEARLARGAGHTSYAPATGQAVMLGNK
ncbi:unnamed protein product, partial [Ectocarpus sp. 13 AM-2016]